MIHSKREIHRLRDRTQDVGADDIGKPAQAHLVHRGLVQEPASFRPVNSLFKMQQLHLLMRAPAAQPHTRSLVLTKFKRWIETIMPLSRSQPAMF